MENVARNEKLTLFLDYFVQQWMEYEKVPIKMLNIYKYRHRANSAVDGWNSKLNSIIGKQQPNVVTQVQKLKEKEKLVSWQLKRKESGKSYINKCEQL